MSDIKNNTTTQEIHAVSKLYNACYFNRQELEALPADVKKKIPYTETEVPTAERPSQNGGSFNRR